MALNSYISLVKGFKLKVLRANYYLVEVTAEKLIEGLDFLFFPHSNRLTMEYVMLFIDMYKLLKNR